MLPLLSTDTSPAPALARMPYARQPSTAMSPLFDTVAPDRPLASMPGAMYWVETSMPPLLSANAAPFCEDDTMPLAP